MCEYCDTAHALVTFDVSIGAPYRFPVPCVATIETHREQLYVEVHYFKAWLDFFWDHKMMMEPSRTPTSVMMIYSTLMIIHNMRKHVDRETPLLKSTRIALSNAVMLTQKYIFPCCRLTLGLDPFDAAFRESYLSIDNDESPPHTGGTGRTPDLTQGPPPETEPDADPDAGE